MKLNHFKNIPPIIWILRIVLIVCIISIFVITLSAYLSEPRIKSTSINLRNKPNPSAHIVKRLKYGARFHIIHKNNQTKWWYVKNNQQRGWMASWLINEQHYNAKKAGNLPEATIVLDPGHGGSDSGTLSLDGKMEKTYTLPLAIKVSKLLKEQNARVLITRTNDKYISLGTRTRLSNRTHANLFISFHFNSSEIDDGGNGYEIFKYHDNGNQIAKQLDKSFNNLPLYNRGIDFGNYYVLRDNHQPAVLMEMGFMNSPSDFSIIQNHQDQNKVVNDTYHSIKNYFN